MSFEIFAPHAVDSYKVSHHTMYTPGTTKIYSNFTPRSDSYFRSSMNNAARAFYDGKVVVFGIQGALKNMIEIWDESFFQKPKDEVCALYASRLGAFSSGLKVDVSHFEALHDYGRLPITVRALKEGTKVEPGIPIFTIHNTQPEFYWVTNYLETWLSNEIWKPCSSATIASVYRAILKHYAVKTGSPISFVNWQGHDFSCRGLSSMDDAAKTGAGHLASFMGTDTLVAVDYIDWAYKGKDTFVGGSVPASEHSVMTLDGVDGELELFRRLITETVPTGVVSLVADGFDYWKVIGVYSQILKKDILRRRKDANGLAKVVFRPDSGDPVDIICGTAWNIPVFDDSNFMCQTLEECRDAAEDYIMNFMDFTSEPESVDVVFRFRDKVWKINAKITWEDGEIEHVDAERAYRHELTPEEKGSVETLWDIFGGTITETGHKLLDSKVGLIYGDSITLDRMAQILNRLYYKGFASANLVFGIGSYAYQYITRDTFGFAMKATYAEVNGEKRNIFKDPKTGASKKSAKGILKVDNGVLLQEQDIPLDDATNHGDLTVVVSDGVRCSEQSIEEIRLRLDKDFYKCENNLQGLFTSLGGLIVSPYRNKHNLQGEQHEPRNPNRTEQVLRY